MQWINNNISNAAYGYVLDGVIGAQPGIAGDYTGNKWLGIWTGARWQTYTMGSSLPASSPMTVLGTPVVDEDPTSTNGSDEILSIYRYSSTNGINASGGTLASCITPPTSTIPEAGVYRSAAMQQLSYTTSVPQKNWIAQMSTFEATEADSTLTDSAAALTSFHNMAVNQSRFKYLRKIERDIAEGHYEWAQDKLAYPIDSMSNVDSDATTGAVMADGTDADDIVQHYKRYYSLRIKLHDSTLTGDDSTEIMTLANMCPYVDGAIVYKARALYSLVYQDERTFSDLGCETEVKRDDSRKSDSTNTEQAMGGQSYTLYPNPSDGNITLRQMVPDGNPAAISVYDAMGNTVYKGQVLFSGQTAHLHAEYMVPGLYLLKIRDGEGRNFILKFVIE